MEKKGFWSSLVIEKSWRVLQELKRKHKFILIGGWAVYLLTNQLKSKDVDIVVSIDELEGFKRAYELRKNDRLKKYEIKEEEIDVDIYVEHYSKLIIPTEEIKKYTIKTQGFILPAPELLLILKQSAYKDRKNSVKGEKDKIDIMSLIFFVADLKRYKEMLKKYKIESYLDELKRLLVGFKDYNLLNLSPREFRLRKNKILLELRKL